MAWITSANVACGGHAGDVGTMRATVRAALHHGVAVGAHPAYPDRDRFGRVEIAMSASEIEDAVASQIEALRAVAAEEGATVVHVKPHGALYHAAMRRREVALAVARGAARVDTELVLVGQAGAPAIEIWRSLGFHGVGEAFADRRYEPDGTLRSRDVPGAVITDPAEAAAQAVRIARGEGVACSDGSTFLVSAGTICVHGDTPRAEAIVEEVRAALNRGGFSVLPMGT